MALTAVHHDTPSSIGGRVPVVIQRFLFFGGAIFSILEMATINFPMLGFGWFGGRIIISTIQQT